MHSGVPMKTIIAVFSAVLLVLLVSNSVAQAVGSKKSTQKQVQDPILKESSNLKELILEKFPAICKKYSGDYSVWINPNKPDAAGTALIILNDLQTFWQDRERLTRMYKEYDEWSRAKQAKYRKDHLKGMEEIHLDRFFGDRESTDGWDFTTHPAIKYHIAA
jgi:hypothetical protein